MRELSSDTPSDAIDDEFEVDFGHGRIDQVKLKAFKHDSALREAKEALEKKYLHLEAYSRRENLKFVGFPSPKAKVRKIQEVS